MPKTPRLSQYYMNDVRNSFLSNNNSYTANLYREHFYQVYQAFMIFKTSSPPPIEEVKKRAVVLPERAKKHMKTIIFDLDETLIHCIDSRKVEGEVNLSIEFPTGEKIIAAINVRPYAKYALEELSKYFQIVIFTASHGCYANKVIDYLDPQNKFVSKRVFRENCIYLPQGIFTKDLRIFTNRYSNEIL